jgi:hypothetical protein
LKFEDSVALPAKGGVAAAKRVHPGFKAFVHDFLAAKTEPGEQFGQHDGRPSFGVFR